MIPIHFHVRAVLDEIFCFVTGFHLAAVDTAVTCERGSARRCDINVGGIFRLSLRAEHEFRRGLCLAQVAAISFVTLPAKGYKDY